MLKDVHIENQGTGLFNANKIIMILGQGKGGTGEHMIRLAEFLFSEYKNNSLTKYSQGNPQILYKKTT